MAESPPVLSIILPVFNDGPAAIRCIDSIRRMDPDGIPLEIIVVDNGSTDGSRDTRWERPAGPLYVSA